MVHGCCNFFYCPLYLPLHPLHSCFLLIVPTPSLLIVYRWGFLLDRVTFERGNLQVSARYWWVRASFIYIRIWDIPLMFPLSLMSGLLQIPVSSAGVSHQIFRRCIEYYSWCCSIYQRAWARAWPQFKPKGFLYGDTSPYSVDSKPRKFGEELHIKPYWPITVVYNCSATCSRWSPWFWLA